jgi:branched-chain amino acid transport system substrate-binding protein
VIRLRVGQAGVAGDYLAERWGDGRIAVLHDGQAYGEGLAEATAERLREHGVEAVLYRAITPGQVDYSELVAEMQAAGIDIVYFGGYAPEAGLILRQARDAGDERDPSVPRMTEGAEASLAVAFSTATR